MGGWPATPAINKRAIILVTAITFGFVLVVFRLVELMLIDHERLSERARGQYSERKDMKAGRGGIFDRRGRELAVNLDVMSVYMNPAEVESPKDAAAVLARATGKSYRSLLRDASSDKTFVWVTRKLDMEASQGLRSLGVKGVEFVPDLKRYYPKGRLASHIVGFVGVDNQPLEGVELRYDEQLRGRQESVYVVRDARGRMLSEGAETLQGGDSVVLTIDEGLQYIVESALERAMEKWSARSASAIMMDPFTGEVLAMANRPTYDLNDSASFPASYRRNRAITDSFEPGSTFKIITAACALEERLVKSDTLFDCSEGFIRVGRKAVWDTHKSGVIEFREVIKASSNVGTVMVGMMAGKQKLYEYIRRFGFGGKTGIDLPGENPGKVNPLDRWSENAHLYASIGYGVAATSLQVLRAYSAVANGGVLVEPHVVSEVISPSGVSTYRYRPGVLERAISRGTADTLREILVSVTEEGGTAEAASVSGNRVAGKTGTVRLLDADTGRYSTEKYASSFAGFAPADRPRIAVVVVLFEPKGEYYGGQVAAPVFKEIVHQSLSYLKVPRDDDFKSDVLFVRARYGQ